MPACIRSSSFIRKDKAFRKTSQSITLKLSCAQPLRTSVKNHWCQWPQRHRKSLFHEGTDHTRYWAIRHSPLALCTHGASYPRSAQLHIPETTIMGIRDAFWLLLSSPEFTSHAELRSCNAAHLNQAILKQQSDLKHSSSDTGSFHLDSLAFTFSPQAAENQPPFLQLAAAGNIAPPSVYSSLATEPVWI